MFIYHISENDNAQCLSELVTGILSAGLMFNFCDDDDNYILAPTVLLQADSYTYVSDAWALPRALIMLCLVKILIML